MKKLLNIKQVLTILSTCFCLFIEAQNLVPNCSFENFSQCPNNFGQVSHASPWIDYYGSVDLFNNCPTCLQSSSSVCVPQNDLGFQYPNMGLSYAGFLFYTKTNNLNQREFIQVELNDSLNPNWIYCFKLRLSLSDSFNYAISNIGAYFTDSSFTTYTLNPPYINTLIPQVKNDSGNYYTNRAGWTIFEKSFVVSAKKKIMTIGNFDFDNQTDTLFVGGAPSYPWRDWSAAYYYIDDISVEKIKPVAAGPDQNIAIGDSIQIGLNLDSAAVYAWQPHIGITDTTAINPWVHPTQTTAYTVIKTQCSVTTTDTLVVYVSPVGMEQYNLQSHFKLYPNPNAGEFTVEQNEELPANLQVYALNGKLVGKYSLKGLSNTIKLANLENGVYFYTISTGNKVLKRDRIVIIH